MNEQSERPNFNYESAERRLAEYNRLSTGTYRTPILPGPSGLVYVGPFSNILQGTWTDSDEEIRFSNISIYNHRSLEELIRVRYGIHTEPQSPPEVGREEDNIQPEHAYELL